MKFYRNLSGFETEYYYSDTVRYKATCNHSDILALKQKVLGLQDEAHIHPSSGTSDSPAAFLIDERLSRVLITERIVFERKKFRTQLIFCASKEAFSSFFTELTAWSKKKETEPISDCLFDGSWDDCTYHTGVGVSFSSDSEPAHHQPDERAVFPEAFSYQEANDTIEYQFDPSSFRQEVVEHLFKSLIPSHRG